MSDLGSIRVGALNDTLARADRRIESSERVTERLTPEVGAIHETVHEVQDDIHPMSGMSGLRGPS